MSLKHRLLLSTAVGLLFSVWSAECAVFAKFEGVEGESTDDKHKGWINLDSISWGASRPLKGSSTGQTRDRGIPVVEDVTITMGIDKSTPYLFEKCLRGEVIPKLEIEQTRFAIGKDGERMQAPYLKYELENVIVSSYSVSSADGGGEPIDEVVLSNNFEKVRMIYTEQRDDGSTEPHVLDYDKKKGA